MRKIATKIFILFAAAFLIAAVSCSKNGEDPAPSAEVTKITATKTTPVQTPIEVKPVTDFNKYMYYSLAQKAETVIVGKVRSICEECRQGEWWEKGSGYSYEFWNVDVVSYILKPQSFDEVQVQVLHQKVRHYDGEYGILTPAFRAPSLAEGEEVLLLLEKNTLFTPLNENQFTIMGLPYDDGLNDDVTGKFLIDNDKAQNTTARIAPEAPWEPLDQIMSAITSIIPIFRPAATPGTPINVQETQ